MSEMSDNTPRHIPSDDDVTGHMPLKWKADAQATEGDDDVEGHTGNKWADAEAAEGDDDVEGHLKKQW